MKEITGNLFDYVGIADVICITTNGFVKKDGKAVMGKGCAKEATLHWPGIDKRLGFHIRNYGNIPYLIKQAGKTGICSFPVKPTAEIFTGSNAVKHMINNFKIGDKVPGWACLANPQIIEYSAALLKDLADKFDWEFVVLPRPGCGAGELDWAGIEPLIQPYLDDRFHSITFA